jgi:hypothetical protein
VPLDFLRLAFALTLLENRPPADVMDADTMIDQEVLDRFNRNDRDQALHLAIIARAEAEFIDPKDPALTVPDINACRDGFTPEQVSAIMQANAKALRTLFMLHFLGVDPEELVNKRMEQRLPAAILMDTLVKRGWPRYTAARKITELGRKAAAHKMAELFKVDDLDITNLRTGHRARERRRRGKKPAVS